MLDLLLFNLSMTNPSLHPLPNTQSWVTVTKSATALPTPRNKPETMVAEMDLSSIN